MLTCWKTRFEKGGALAFRGHGRRAETDAEAEIRRLQRELAIDPQEHDIPRRAAAYFGNAKN